MLQKSGVTPALSIRKELKMTHYEGRKEYPKIVNDKEGKRVTVNNAEEEAEATGEAIAADDSKKSSKPSKTGTDWK